METISIKVKRQDDADGLPYWERFEIPYEEGMTVAQALIKIGIASGEDGGNETAPPCSEVLCMEGACGACAMMINGRLALACTTPVDSFSGTIVLEPLPKFPVVRDLVVDRSSMSLALGDLRAYALIGPLSGEGVLDQKTLPELADRLAAFDGCCMCGVCAAACPSVSDRSEFYGAFAMARFVILEENPWTANQSAERIAAVAGKGGISGCFGASCCERACPLGLALACATATAGRIAGVRALAVYFRKV